MYVKELDLYVKEEESEFGTIATSRVVRPRRIELGLSESRGVLIASKDRLQDRRGRPIDRRGGFKLSSRKRVCVGR